MNGAPETVVAPLPGRFVRRRLAVSAAAVAIVWSVAWLLGSLLGPAAAAGGEAATSLPVSYTVQSGDTLWTIAGALGLDADRRVVVEVLAAANGGTAIEPGQELVFPDELADV